MAAAGIEIQAAVQGDAPALAALHAAAFSSAWDEEALEAFIADAACVTLIARDAATEALGFVLSRRAADEAEVLTLTVRPDRRRAGVGALLLDALMRDLEGQGVTLLFLEVADDNDAARALYRRFGFGEVGRRPGYYHSGEDQARRDALLLKKALEPHL